MGPSHILGAFLWLFIWIWFFIWITLSGHRGGSLGPLVWKLKVSIWVFIKKGPLQESNSLHFLFMQLFDSKQPSGPVGSSKSQEKGSSRFSNWKIWIFGHKTRFGGIENINYCFPETFLCKSALRTYRLVIIPRKRGGGNPGLPNKW